MFENDWRITNQANYLKGKKLLHTYYKVTNDNWEHEHCEFCWDKLTDNDLAFCTLDKYYWICEKCFEDFKDTFEWSIIVE